MARPYSVDLRERVVRAVEAGTSRRAAAAQLEVSVSFVVKLMQRWRRRGTLRPDRIGGWKRSALAAHDERLDALLAAEPDLTIAKLRTRLAAEGIAVRRSAIGRFLAAGRLTRKKKTQHATEQARADVAAARLAWRERQAALRPEQEASLSARGAPSVAVKKPLAGAGALRAHRRATKPFSCSRSSGTGVPSIR